MTYSKQRPSARELAEAAVLAELRFPASWWSCRWGMNHGLPWYRKWTRLTVWLTLQRLVRAGVVEYTDVPVDYPNWIRVYHLKGYYDESGSDGGGAGGQPGDALAVA